MGDKMQSQQWEAFMGTQQTEGSKGLRFRKPWQDFQEAERQ